MKHFLENHKFYVYVNPSRRYSRTETGEPGVYSYTLDVENGTWIKYGEGKYAEYNVDNLYARICKTNADKTVECQYAKNNVSGYEEVTENNKVYLEVYITTYNYAIGEFNAVYDPDTGEFEDARKINVTAAGITVTPVEKQNKIYCF